MSMRIVHLADAPEVLPTLIDWFVDEWTPWYGPGGGGDAANDLASCLNRDEIPLALVALDASEEVLGTAALKPESVGSETGSGPWLAALLVDREHRHRGIGTALIEAIEAEAWRLGFASLYTSTDVAESLLRRRGWQAVGTAESLRGTITIYRLRAPD